MTPTLLNSLRSGPPQFGQTVKAARRFDEREATTPEEAHALHYRMPDGDGRKVPGISLSEVGFNVAAAQRYREEQCTKQEGSGPPWFDSALCKKSSRSDSRKAASAQIARIPFLLSSYIARALHP